MAGAFTHRPVVLKPERASAESGGLDNHPHPPPQEFLIRVWLGTVNLHL